MDVTIGAVVLTIGKGKGNEFGELYYPQDVALDLFGNLLVADMGNQRIAVFNASDGTPITSFSTPFQPYSVFVDQLGNVIVGGGHGLFMWRSSRLQLIDDGTRYIPPE